jgi:hypothetical protein
MAPDLEARLAGSNVILSWPGSATNYNLQSASVLHSGFDPGEWVPVTNMPVIINSRNTVTNALSQPSQYYRLKKQ